MTVKDLMKRRASILEAAQESLGMPSNSASTLATVLRQEFRAVSLVNDNGLSRISNGLENRGQDAPVLTKPLRSGRDRYRRDNSSSDRQANGFRAHERILFCSDFFEQIVHFHR
jgi:hypothetical protein